MEKIRKFFKINSQTTLSTEILAGLTTFFTMSYLILINPKLLELAGMPYFAAYSANLLVAGFACILMGLYANKPYTIAPYLGDNVFIAYTLVMISGYTWQEVFGLIFVSGIVLFVLTLTKFRRILINSIPTSIKIAFSTALGLYLFLSGLMQSGLIKCESNITSLKICDLSNGDIWLSFCGLAVILLLNGLKIRLSVIIGVVVMFVTGILIGDVSIPSNILSMPPSVAPVFAKLDLSDLFSARMFSMLILIFLIINSETIGSIATVALKDNKLFRNGGIKQVKKIVYVDSVSTTLAPLFGAPTTGVYVDAITGIEAGGKTGLTSFVAGCLFLLSLFLSPLMSKIPVYAYAPAIMYVGLLLLKLIQKLQFNDWTEYLPALTTIFVTVGSLNIGRGMAAGFIIYPLLKFVSGRKKEISKPLLVLTIFSVLYFILSFC